VSPDKTPIIRGYEGWAYCARTPDKAIFLAYFEKGCPPSQIRGARLHSIYRAEWFDPRTGAWSDAGSGEIESSQIGIMMLPPFPADADWGLRLTYIGHAGHRP
jgi:Putative collagen-binding domain of a collagenase